MIKIEKQSGRFFTLIELLLTIAIISILASMLLPALGKARERAKETKCTGNQKQCVLASIMYMDDYNGWMTFYPYNDATKKEKVWAGLLIDGKYLRNPKSAACPKFASFPGWNGTDAQTYAATSVINFKYAALMGGKKVMNKIKPTELFLLGDGIEISSRHLPWLRMTPTSASADLAVPVAWHTGRIAFGFYDGHAGTLRPNEIRPGGTGQAPTGGSIHQFYDATAGYWYNFSRFIYEGKYNTSDQLMFPN